MAQQKSRYQFRLRTQLIVVTVLAIAFGWFRWEVEQVRKEQATVDWIGDMGGSVTYPEEIAFFSKDKFFGVRVTGVGLNYEDVRDLSPLAELKNLKTLDLNNAQASDLSPLAELKNLETLQIKNMPVSDLSPLAELTKLELLRLFNTQVTDLSPLAESKNLKELFFLLPQVSDEQVQVLKQALPSCSIFGP